MKQLIVFIGLWGWSYALPAQTGLAETFPAHPIAEQLISDRTSAPAFPTPAQPLRGDSIPATHPSDIHHTRLHTFIHNFRLELPMLEISYNMPASNKALLNLPYGMDKFMYPVRPGVSPVSNNYSVRWIAIFYKDKIGIELYSDGFGSSVNMSDFSRYMTAQFPGYYVNPNAYSNNNNAYDFDGQSLGIAYRIHLRSFILEPKFLLGFESLNGDSTFYSSYLKAKGSNQFMEYYITQSEAPHRQHSYHGRLLAGYRFHPGKKATEIEVGSQWEYIYSPYSLQVDLSQQPYGQPEIDHHLDLKETWRQWSVGVYFKVYLHKWIY